MTPLFSNVINPKARQAFTLIEINITLLVLSVGMLGILGLFPVGLRQGSIAIDDTNQALFVDHVFGLLRSEAAAITDWDEWTKLLTRVNANVYVDKNNRIRAFGISDKERDKERGDTINDYLVKGNVIRYRLTLYPVTEPIDFEKKLWRASIRVLNRELGELDMSPAYTTDFVFTGKIPTE